MSYYRRKPLDVFTPNGAKELYDNSTSGISQCRSVPASEYLEETVSEETASLVTKTPAVSSTSERRGDSEACPRDPTDLVQTAAGILDKEMAAGALSARLVDTQKFALPIMGGARQNGTDRFMSDVEELLGKFAKIVSLSQKDAAEGTLSTLQRTADPDRIESQEESVPLLSPHRSVQPGKQAKIFLKLNNDSLQSIRLTLQATDLVGSTGFRIPKQQIMFTPCSISMAPDANTNVTITVSVPPEAMPGTYTGLLLAQEISYLRAVITLTVCTNPMISGNDMAEGTAE